MPKFQLNSKQAEGRQRKAEAAAEKQRQQASIKEKKEAESWALGSKDEKKKAELDAKRMEKLALKKEREEALKQEEAQLGHGAKLKLLKSSHSSLEIESRTSETSDALSELSLASEDRSGGEENASLDRHPERRMKAAYNEYEERELPGLKAQYPSLRLSQLKEMLYRKWKKSPENPFNKPHVAYDA